MESYDGNHILQKSKVVQYGHHSRSLFLREIEKIVERATPASFLYNDNTFSIYMVENNQRHLTSDVGNVLCEMFPSIDFAVITFTTPSYCSLSLRGIKGKCPDLCAIAKAFGGGGHPSSSGMRVPNLKRFKNIT